MGCKNNTLLTINFLYKICFCTKLNILGLFTHPFIQNKLFWSVACYANKRMVLAFINTKKTMWLQNCFELNASGLTFWINSSIYKTFCLNKHSKTKCINSKDKWNFFFVSCNNAEHCAHVAVWKIQMSVDFQLMKADAGALASLAGDQLKSAGWLVQELTKNQRLLQGWVEESTAVILRSLVVLDAKHLQKYPLPAEASGSWPVSVPAFTGTYSLQPPVVL